MTAEQQVAETIELNPKKFDSLLKKLVECHVSEWGTWRFDVPALPNPPTFIVDIEAERTYQWKVQTALRQLNLKFPRDVASVFGFLELSPRNMANLGLVSQSTQEESVLMSIRELYINVHTIDVGGRTASSPETMFLDYWRHYGFQDIEE
jgi:hypothetical protein